MAIYPRGQTFLHNVLYRWLLKPAAELSRAQRNTKGKNTWSKLSKLHLRNFGYDNIFRTSVRPLLHISGCEMSHLLAGSPRRILAVFNLVLDINVMAIWQLSKKASLTGVTWLYRGVRCATHWIDVFFKLSADNILVFNWSLAQVHSFRVEFSLLYVYGKSLWLDRDIC